MFKTLRDLLAPLAAPAAGTPDPKALELACAVLLVEVMKADPQTAPAEREAVLRALRQRFALGEEALQDLLAMAEAASRSASSFHQFTAELNERLPQSEKVHIVETLWQVAYADGHLDAHENHVISRIAGLLHVTHGEYIAAKLHAKQAAGL
ncbi:TerB family tellurite resistance protein [Ramlibacter tataouinensis]|uniref:tellurite resistance TerB family protein n=1 Tax=Ramlibacter tataouinensis TaxID=94132 RepID=UPI0022F3A933|nr:TerB family tellurite resistance protein [Ramlibacter tataouinensis]WBY01106.1 TerB family tellurite resistance protein [Ramlibacter tataouinensis]